MLRRRAELRRAAVSRSTRSLELRRDLPIPSHRTEMMKQRSLEHDAAVEGEDEGVEFVVHAGSLGLEVDEGTTGRWSESAAAACNSACSSNFIQPPWLV
ncbi:hypothetical protein ACFX13_046904 [Malus domestica]